MSRRGRRQRSNHDVQAGSVENRASHDGRRRAGRHAGRLWFVAVGRVPVDWPDFREPRLATAPSEPAQCPDLTGPYRIQGEFRTGERDASLDDLGRFLAWTLYLPGMGGGDSRAWNPAPGASVTFASDAQAWRALLRDGRGGKLEGRLPGAASPAGDLVDPARQQIMLVSGCAQGRLWISAREDWRQHESQGVRHVAMLRPEGGGLLLTVRRGPTASACCYPGTATTAACRNTGSRRPDPDERGRGGARRLRGPPAVFHFLRCAHDRKTTDLLRRAVPVVRAGRDLVLAPALRHPRASCAARSRARTSISMANLPSTTPPSTAPGWKRPDAAMSTRSTPWA